VGEYYSARFGGDPEIWGEANHKLISSIFNIFWRNGKDKFDDYQTFYNDFKKNMVLGMFKETGMTLPRKLNPVEIFDSARQFSITRLYRF
ncbi:unnamed protein product, partial [marine sediment metagenome]